MANITLAGTLRDPNGDLAVGDKIRFTHKSTTGETVKSASSILTIDPTGVYSVDLEYGLILVEYKDARNSQFENLGVATVNGTNPATTIPELLNALVPVSSAELIEFQAILADCVTAKDAAELAALVGVIPFDTVTDYKNYGIALAVGRIVYLEDRGAKFTVIAGTNTANNLDIISSAGINQSITIKSPPTMQNLGALNDGSNDTARANRLNALTKVMVFDADKLFTLQNFVPLTGTTIIAKGATINKLDNTPYLALSAAAIVFENDGLLLKGGTHGDNNNGQTFSGSVLIYKGSNQRITGAKFIESWGGITGLQDQNDTDFANDVTIDHCVFDGCTHNTYLADIHGFNFTDNHSKNSTRDGLRTYRNVINLVITGNHLYNNGDGTVGQSQDGMDLFFAGNKAIITGNYIHGNFTQGIDVKRAASAVGVVNFDRQYTIANNFIYSNGASGISCEVNDVPTYGALPDVNIHDNEIYNNTLWGVFAEGCDNFKANNNNVWGNGRDGFRLEVLSGTTKVRGNTFRDNGQSQVSVGLLILATVDYAIVTGNSGEGSTGQTTGLDISSAGICRDNNFTGHATNYSGVTRSDGKLRGEAVHSSVDNTSNAIAVMSPKDGSIAAMSMSIAATQAGTTVTVQKRNVTTGANESTLFNGTIDFTAFVAELIPMPASASARALSQDQVIIINISGATFTSASTVSHIIT